MEQDLKEELVTLTEEWLSAAMQQQSDDAAAIRAQINEKLSAYPEELALEEKAMSEAAFPQQYAMTRIAHLIGG